MKLNFLFMDESYNPDIKPPISSLTGILVPLEKYPTLRSKFYEALNFEIEQDKGIINLSPPALHFSNLLRHHENDEVRFNVLSSLVNLVVDNQLEMFRVGYYITKNIEKTFEDDKRLIGLCWFGMLSMLQSKLETEMVVPVMDAGFEKNMKQMTKQFSGTMKTLDVMRAAKFEVGVSIKHSENILDVFYADDKYSIFTQLADIVSGLRRISETANQDSQLINSEYKKKLFPISEQLVNAPMREEIHALILNDKMEGPPGR